MTEHCKSCKAPIEFVRTPKGARLPLDVASHPKANIVVDELGIAHVVGEGNGVRISHFVTCPNAARHRRPRPGPRR